MFAADIERVGATFAFAVKSAVFGFAVDKCAVADRFAERHSCVFSDKAVASCSVGGVCFFAADFHVFKAAAMLLIVCALNCRTVYIGHFFIILSVFYGFAALLFYPINRQIIIVKKN